MIESLENDFHIKILEDVYEHAEKNDESEEKNLHMNDHQKDNEDSTENPTEAVAENPMEISNHVDEVAEDDDQGVQEAICPYCGESGHEEGNCPHRDVLHSSDHDNSSDENDDDI